MTSDLGRRKRLIQTILQTFKVMVFCLFILIFFFNIYFFLIYQRSNFASNCLANIYLRDGSLGGVGAVPKSLVSTMSNALLALVRKKDRTNHL